MMQQPQTIACPADASAAAVAGLVVEIEAFARKAEAARCHERRQRRLHVRLGQLWRASRGRSLLTRAVSGTILVVQGLVVLVLTILLHLGRFVMDVASLCLPWACYLPAVLLTAAWQTVTATAGAGPAFVSPVAVIVAWSPCAALWALRWLCFFAAPMAALYHRRSYLRWRRGRPVTLWRDSP